MIWFLDVWPFLFKIHQEILHNQERAQIQFCSGELLRWFSYLVSCVKEYLTDEAFWSYCRFSYFSLFSPYCSRTYLQTDQQICVSFFFFTGEINSLYWLKKLSGKWTLFGCCLRKMIFRILSQCSWRQNTHSYHILFSFEQKWFSESSQNCNFSDAFQKLFYPPHKDSFKTITHISSA